MEGSQLEDMMQSQYRVSLLSPGVSKILTACRFKKTLMLGYVQKAEMHSFPNMPIMGWVALVEVGQKKDFLKKNCLKTGFLRDTNLDCLADLLGPKLSDWRPFEFFTKGHKKCKKLFFFAFGQFT